MTSQTASINNEIQAMLARLSRLQTMRKISVEDDKLNRSWYAIFSS